jgi:hypothetical protein
MGGGCQNESGFLRREMDGNAVNKALNKLIPFMVRQAHHERNQQLTVRPELVEGLIQSFLKKLLSFSLREKAGMRGSK